MSNGSEETVTFACAAEKVRDGDTLTAALTETTFSFLIGFKGGTEDKTSKGEGVRFLGAWCPERNTPAGVEAANYTNAWLVKHDHPKQHAWSKTLVATCSTSDLRDNFGRFLALVRCTNCGACLNEDLVANGHATRERMLARSTTTEYEQHRRALETIRGVMRGRRSGANAMLAAMAGQTSLLQALDEQTAST